MLLAKNGALKRSIMITKYAYIDEFGAFGYNFENRELFHTFYCYSYHC